MVITISLENGYSHVKRKQPHLFQRKAAKEIENWTFLLYERTQYLNVQIFCSLNDVFKDHFGV